MLHVVKEVDHADDADADADGADDNDDNAQLLWCYYYGPVGESQDEQFQEGGLEQQVLVLFVQVGESGDFLRPAPDDLHGSGQ